MPRNRVYSAFSSLKTVFLSIAMLVTKALSWSLNAQSSPSRFDVSRWADVPSSSMQTVPLNSRPPMEHRDAADPDDQEVLLDLGEADLGPGSFVSVERTVQGAGRQLRQDGLPVEGEQDPRAAQLDETLEVGGEGLSMVPFPGHLAQGPVLGDSRLLEVVAGAAAGDVKAAGDDDV